MAAVIRFTIPFAPVAWQRAGVTWTNEGPKHYTPEKTRTWKHTVSLVAKSAMAGQKPVAGAVELELDFALQIPPSWPLWKRQQAASGHVAPTAKPDLDNYEKAIKDALNGIAWADDAQVVAVTKRKRYAINPGVAVSFRELPVLSASVSRKP